MAIRALISVLLLQVVWGAPLNACSPLELIIARGTTEPLYPAYGIVVGDPLFEETKKVIPGVTGYKVNYPASFEPTSKSAGTADVLAHLAAQSKACPSQSFVLAGYSQGADLMHSAGAQIPPALYPRIIAIVLFGDPGNRGPNVTSPLGGIIPPFPDELAQKVKENCEKGDPVCTNSGKVVADHLAYTDDDKGYMPANAAYIKKQFETGGKAGPSPSPNGGVQDKGSNVDALKELGEILGATKGELQALDSMAGAAPKNGP